MTQTIAGDARRSLESLADEAWAGSMAAEPLYATAIGNRDHLSTLPVNDDAGREQERVRLASLVERVTAVPEDDLKARDRITRSALLDFVEFERHKVLADVDRWTVDQVGGPQVEFLNVESYQPIGTPEEAAAATERWRAMGPWIDSHVADLRSAVGAGLVAPRTNVLRVIDELDDLLGQDDDAWPLSAPARDEHPAWPDADRAAFSDAILAAVRDVIRPAFARQRAALVDEILPLSRSDERSGLCHLPGGDGAYHHLVQAHTTLALDPEAIHRTGLAEVARIDGEFADLGSRALGTSGREAAIERLRHDPALRFRTSDEVRATAEAALARATAATPAWFGRPPVTPCEVVVMGAHESKHSTIAYYRDPAADGSRPGRYYLNTTEPETRPRYEAECLAFHESVPGHHLQVAVAQELEDLPDFQRFAGPTAFVEGWGLYTERLSDEMGLYSGDLDRFGILSFDAWRACRLVVDTGIHALGWSRDRAIAFMAEHTALAENNIVNEVDRYIAWPGQALAYKIGQLEIGRLRHDAEAQLGDRFSIAAFHDTVLGWGAIGLVTLRASVADWVAEVGG